MSGRRKPTSAEAEAREALRRARAAARPMEPDKWGTEETGERYGFVSCGKLNAYARELLAAEGLEVELLGAENIGGQLKTLWTWGTTSWRSAPVKIDMPWHAGGGRSASTAVAGAHALARKEFNRQLLDLQAADDAQAELERAMDAGREAAWEAMRDCARAYCRKFKISEDYLLRTLTGMNPGVGVEMTVGHLTPPQVAAVWQWLLHASWDASKAVDLGAPPDDCEELPDGFGDIGGKN